MFIDRLIVFSIKNRGLVFLLTAVTCFFGWVSVKSLPIDAVPDITNVQVQVNTAVDGLIPEEIERFISFPIESALGGLPNVEEVRSISRFGLSQVSVIFNEGTDLFLSRQLVSERLGGIRDSLPMGVSPELGPITTGLGEIYFYGLEAKEIAEGEQRLVQLMELRALNEWSIKPRLLTVPGVAEVNAIGGYEKQFHVQPDIKKLARYGIHLDELVEALKNNNRSAGGGYIQQSAEQLLVQATGLLNTIDDIRDIVVKRLPNFNSITIGDLAEVGPGREIRTGAALINGQEAVVGTVLMLLGGNSRTVSSDVEQKIEEIQKSLPDWAVLEPLYARSDLVDKTLKTVQGNLLYGAGLVALVLLLILGNFRAAVITAIVIPLSLLVTFILMRRFNISGNLMSLGALDFGIIIDGAVIVLDNCIRRIQEARSKSKDSLTRNQIKEIVSDATIEIRSAAGFGQLIIIIVFLPIFALSGVEAKMFIPMASSFAFALGASFIFSFTLVPALAASFLSGKTNAKHSIIMSFFQKLYLPSLKVALKLRWLVVALGVAVILGGFILFKGMGADFLPQLDEGSIAVQFVRPTNISLDQSVRLQELSEKSILEFKEVERVISRIGTAEVATDPMGANLSDTYIILKNKEKWEQFHSKKDLISAIKKKLELEIPGQTLIFSQPIQLRFNELLEGVRSDVALKIYGDNLEKLAEISQEAVSFISQVNGAGDVETEIKDTSPVLRVKPKTSVLQELGIPKEDVIQTVETAIGGTKAGSLYEGVRSFPIIVRLPENMRDDLSTMSELPVGVDENLTVPLNKMATLTIDDTFSDIRRESSSRRVAVLINVRGRDTSSFVEEAKMIISQKLKLPEGYYVEWGGSFKNLQKAKERLAIVVPVALISIFILIYFAFNSLTQTILIFACIPMALGGGVLGLILNDLNFSISAAIGFIALSGISVLNGIVLISFFNNLKLSGESGDEMILKGAILRLRPVLMTAMAAAFGFLPMMTATGAGAEVQKPLASVVVGGIITATLLTLIILPCVYRILENKMKISENGIKH